MSHIAGTNPRLQIELEDGSGSRKRYSSDTYQNLNAPRPSTVLNLPALIGKGPPETSWATSVVSAFLCCHAKRPAGFHLKDRSSTRGFNSSATTPTGNGRVHKHTGTISFGYPTYKVSFQNRLEMTLSPCGPHFESPLYANLITARVPYEP